MIPGKASASPWSSELTLEPSGSWIETYFGAGLAHRIGSESQIWTLVGHHYRALDQEDRRGLLETRAEGKRFRSKSWGDPSDG